MESPSTVVTSRVTIAGETRSATATIADCSETSVCRICVVMSPPERPSSRRIVAATPPPAPKSSERASIPAIAPRLSDPFPARSELRAACRGPLSRVIQAAGPVAGSGSNRSGERRFTGAFTTLFGAAGARFAFSTTLHLLWIFGALRGHAQRGGRLTHRRGWGIGT